MEVTVDTSTPCLAKVSLKVPADEFEQQFTRALRQVGSRTKMKGFRPGKTPLKVVEREHGEQIKNETIEHFLREGFGKAVEDNKLSIAAHPRIDPTQIKLERGEDFAQEFEVFLRPEFEMGEYKGLSAESPAVEVTDEELSTAREQVAQQQSRVEPADPEAGLSEDGMALCRLELVSGEEVVFERDGLRLSPGEVPIPVDEAAYKEAMVGKHDEDVVELPFEFPEDFEREELRGQQGTARFTIRQTFQVTPPTDEELWKLLEAENEEQMMDRIRERVSELKEQRESQRVESLLLEQLIDAHPMALPQGMVDDQVRSREAEVRRDLEGQEIPEPEIEVRLASERPTLQEAAERAMRAMYLIETIAKNEELLVTQDDLRGELTQIAQRNGAPPEDVEKYYREQGLLNQLGMELLERKVRAFLRENADISGR